MIKNSVSLTRTGSVFKRRSEPLALMFAPDEIEPLETMPAPVIVPLETMVAPEIEPLETIV